MQKLILQYTKEWNKYERIASKGHSIDYIEVFLNDYGYQNISYYIEWCQEPGSDITGGNITEVEKKDNQIIIGMQYTEEEKYKKNFFKITPDQFIVLLNEWKTIVDSKIEKITITEHDGVVTMKEYQESDAIPDHEKNVYTPDPDEPTDSDESQDNFLTFNFDHIFDIIHTNTAQLMGLHHDFLGHYEETKIIQLESLVIGPFGEYKATVLWNGTVTKNKRFFPKHWTRTQVMENIIEAYDNFIASGAQPRPQADGFYHIKSHTNAGMGIEMIINDKYFMLTTYPII